MALNSIFVLMCR